MRDVEKFERFEDLKKSESESVKSPTNDKNEVEEFIELLVKNAKDEGLAKRAF